MIFVKLKATLGQKNFPAQSNGDFFCDMKLFAQENFASTVALEATEQLVGVFVNRNSLAQEDFTLTFESPIVTDKLENRRRVDTNSRISFAVKV